MPADRQTIPQHAAVTKGVIAYEGFAKTSTFDTLYMDKKGPVAQGDGPKWVPGKNPDVSQFSVYGSGHVGIFGAIVEKTNIEGVLKLDVLATDFYRNKAYPTYLIYNPFAQSKTVAYKVKGIKKVDLYDAISQKVIVKNIAAKSNVSIAGNHSVLIVEVPAGSKLITTNKKLVANGIVIDYMKK
ncbi:hypothetical protein [Pedobacter agri]|nr:hypothetical protein [Pedobacter agri]